MRTQLWFRIHQQLTLRDHRANLEGAKDVPEDTLVEGGRLGQTCAPPAVLQPLLSPCRLTISTYSSAWPSW